MANINMFGTVVDSIRFSKAGHALIIAKNRKWMRYWKREGGEKRAHP